MEHLFCGSCVHDGFIMATRNFASMTDGSRVAEFLSERPDLESPLEDVLEVDEQTDSWTFDDVPVDSGRFGELVSPGIVEREGEDYRVADPDAVRAALGEGIASGTVKGGRSKEWGFFLGVVTEC
jgi:dolichyl-diphosphooligosaccharide--protein glycosyltransferase